MYRYFLRIIKPSLLFLWALLIFPHLAPAYEDRIDSLEALSILNLLDVRKPMPKLQKTLPAPKNKNISIIIYRCAKPYIGRVPYAWGGTSIRTGMDCSAFSRFILAKFGFSLPRTARAQAIEGRAVQINRLRPGDLIFFDASKHRPGIDHVGVYIGRGYFVHSCAGKGVTLDKLGMYNYEIVAARRIL